MRTAANSFGSDRPNYSYTLNPGADAGDAMVVTNRGTTPLDPAVYAADGYTTRTGQFDLTTASAHPKGVGAWVHPEQGHITIGPDDRVRVPFTVMVPDDARPGDHLGGIVTSLTQADAAGVAVERRLALRIRLRVSGALEPRLSVEQVGVAYDGTANPLGKGEPSSTTRSTTPATPSWSPDSVPRSRVRSSVHGVMPAGRLTARVTLIPLLADAAGSISPLATINATTYVWTIPWALLLIVLVSVLVLATIGRWRRQRTRMRRDTPVQKAVSRPPANYAPSSADTR